MHFPATVSAAKTTHVVADSKSQILPKPRRRKKSDTQPLFGLVPAKPTRSGLPSLFAGRSAPSAKQARTLAAVAAVDGGWDDFVSAEPTRARPSAKAPTRLASSSSSPVPRRRRGPSAAELAAKRLANAAAESLARAAQAKRPVEDKPQPVTAPVPTAGKPVVARAKAKGPRFLAMGSIPPQIDGKPLPSLFSVIDKKPVAGKSQPVRPPGSAVPHIQSDAGRPMAKAASIAVPAPRDPEPELDDELDALHVEEEEWYASITRVKSRPLPPAVVVEAEPAIKPQLVIVDEVVPAPEPMDDFVAAPAPVETVSAPAMAEQFSRVESDFFAAGEQLADTAEFQPIDDFADLDQARPKKSLWQRLRGRN